MGARWLLLAILVLPALAAPAAACGGVPCGRIYPIILLATADEGPTVHEPRVGEPVTVDLTLTYKFDALNDGYTVTTPTDPVFVTFEFPRKPAWVDIRAQPERLEIPVNDPRFFGTPDPNSNTMPWSYETSFRVTFTVTGQAVLRDGAEYAKLLVFAKSSESGLYQAGYGIREVRVAPEGAVHESDVAGLRDVFAASPLPPMDLRPVERAFPGLTLGVQPPARGAFWQSATWSVKLSPPPMASALVAIHDERGDLVATHGPVDASVGTLTFNATLARPGLHTVTVTLGAQGGSRIPAATYAVDLVAGALAAEGFAFDKTYLVISQGRVPAPTANSADPTMQWERDVPFFAFESAQSMSAVVTLATPVPADAGRGLANVQFSFLDPDGNLLATTSVDPTNPQRAIRVSSAPTEGWYTLRLRGVGLPAAATYDARVEVDYATEPRSRNRADGVADPTPAVLARAGRNLTLPVDALAVWAPGDVTPQLDRAPNAQYSVTVYDEAGTLVYASGVRAGKASFTPPAPGAYRAFVHAEPAPGAPFSPLVRAFAFAVGEGETVTATKFALADVATAPAALTETLVAVYAVPFATTDAKPTLQVAGGRAELVDAEGRKVDEPTTPGTYFLRVFAEPGPSHATSVAYALDFPAPVTLVGPPPLGMAATTDGGLPVPGLAVATALLVAGGVAVAIAIARRG